MMSCSNIFTSPSTATSTKRDYFIRKFIRNKVFPHYFRSVYVILRNNCKKLIGGHRAYRRAPVSNLRFPLIMKTLCVHKQEGKSIPHQFFTILRSEYNPFAWYCANFYSVISSFHFSALSSTSPARSCESEFCVYEALYESSFLSRGG